MRKRQKCIECGIQVPGSVTTYRNKSGRPMLCSECLKALREQQKISKRDTIRSTLDLKCVVCGKLIPWKNSYVYKNRRPKTCSGSCHGLYAKLNYLVSKQQLIERIDKYIQSHKRYVTRQQLSKAGIAYPKQLSKHRISTLLQNKKVLGQAIYAHNTVPVYRTHQPKQIQQIKQQYSIHGASYAQLTQALLYTSSCSKQLKRRGMKDLVEAYTYQIGRFVPVVVLAKALGLCYQTLRKWLPQSSSQIQRKIGIINNRASWFQDIAYKVLLDMFPHSSVLRQYTFPKCISSKGYMLRFDFYIPQLNLLIQVDGSQHTDVCNPYYRSQQVANDNVKQIYADQNNIQLMRVITTPSHTFQRRLRELLEVVKPIELLGHCQVVDGACTVNQQPSLERRTKAGSETIEQKTEQLQFQF